MGALFAILSNMIQFIHTDLLPEKATKQYLLNLGVENVSDYRRNADPPRERVSTKGDPYAHRLINIVLRQAKALGYKNIDLNAWNVKTGDEISWSKLPSGIQHLTVVELEQLIRMQVSNYIGKVPPRATCMIKGELVDIPMIIEWSGKLGLYWNPPILYTQAQGTLLNTYIVYDFNGDALPVEVLKQCQTCNSILVSESGHQSGKYSGQEIWRCDFRTCLDPDTGLQKEWEDLPRASQLVLGGMRTIPKCFGKDEKGHKYGEDGWQRDSITWFKLFRSADIRRYFTIERGPLPFLPAEWYKKLNGKILAKGTGLVKMKREKLLEIFKADLATVAEIDDLFLAPTYNVEAVINPSGYYTPTGNRVDELELTYVDKEVLEGLQRRGNPPQTSAEDKFEWQNLALSRLEDSGWFGMVQACTGSGKTVLIAKAIKAVYNDIDTYGGSKPCVNIIVPTKPLLDQWYAFLKCHTEVGKNYGFAGTEVGRFASGYKDQLQPINVFVINSAAKYLRHIIGDPKSDDVPNPGFFDDLSQDKLAEIPKHLSIDKLKEFHTKYPNQFLIVDEAHRSTGTTFRQIYESAKKYLLMVSATFPEDEDKFKMLEEEATSPEHLEGQGGMLCYYKYPHALKKGNISDFNLHYLRVGLTGKEGDIYGLITALISDFMKQGKAEAKKQDQVDYQGISGVLCPCKSGRLFEGCHGDPSTKGSYFEFMAKVLGGARARISWTSGARLQCALDLLIEKLEERKSIIVFHKSIDGASALYKLLYDRGYGCAPTDPATGRVPSTPDISNLESEIFELNSDLHDFLRKIKKMKIADQNRDAAYKAVEESVNHGLLDPASLRSGRRGKLKRLPRISHSDANIMNSRILAAHGEELKYIGGGTAPSPLYLKNRSGYIKELLDTKRILLKEKLRILYSEPHFTPGKDEIGIYHSKLHQKTRDAYLKRFKEGKIKCLISVQSLLEGIDVPHCEVGVAVAADQSLIKIVQALGRVLRISPGSPNKKDYYFICADGTKDEEVRAKFDNEVKDQNGEWIIDQPTLMPPATELPFTITDEQRVELQKEAGLPTTVELASFIKDLISKQDGPGSWDHYADMHGMDINLAPETGAETNMEGLEDDLEKEDSGGLGTQRVRVNHPYWADPEHSYCLPEEP